MADGGVAADDAAPATEIAEPPTMFGVPCTDERGQQVLHPSRDEYLDVLGMAAADGYELCVDVCAVDGLTNRTRAVAPGIEPERFEVVVNLLDLRGRRRLRIRTQVPADDPQVPSAVGLYPGAEAPEREAAATTSAIVWSSDAALRKDTASLGAIPVQFKAVEGR